MVKGLKKLNAIVWKEGDWYVAQCLDVDIASQGKTEQEAITNLKEALELYFEEPRSTVEYRPHIVEIEVRVA